MATPLYFTYGSPFCYLAWHRILAHPERYPGVTFRWTPVLFRKMDLANGGSGGGSNKAQLDYSIADCGRWAKAYGIPFVYHHRKNPADQTAHKVHLLAQDAGADWEARWMKAVFEAVRLRGEDYTIREVTLALAKKLGVPGLERIDDAALEARLEANTNQAVAAGVSGVPFIVHDGKAYWGNDRLNWLEADLAGQSFPTAI